MRQRSRESEVRLMTVSAQGEREGWEGGQTKVYHLMNFSMLPLPLPLRLRLLGPPGPWLLGHRSPLCHGIVMFATDRSPESCKPQCP